MTRNAMIYRFACFVVVVASSLLVSKTLSAKSNINERPLIALDNKEIVQGALVKGKILRSDWQVIVDGKRLRTNSRQQFVLGVGRDHARKLTFKLVQDGTKKQRLQTFEVKPRQWKVERVDGLPPETVTPKSKAVIQRIIKEAAAVRNARNIESQLPFFRQSFIQPAVGRISGVYGSQRILNGKPKRPHFGLDIANVVGTPVVAPAKGKVVLVAKDMFYSGGTMIIDHGYGINSTFLHLSKILVKEGDSVDSKQTIGLIGQSGRASGPHLDWRVNWFQTRLDPYLLIKH